MEDVLTRFSVSMPTSALEGLDRLSEERGFVNRSQALTSLVRDAIMTHKSAQSDEVMMGIISFIYEHQKRNLQHLLSDLQHEHLKEIVTIQLVHLEHDLSLQILLVQGPVSKLQSLADSFAALKGVRNARLNLSAELLPPLHQP